MTRSESETRLREPEVLEVNLGELQNGLVKPEVRKEGATLGANCNDPRGCAGACLALGVTAARWRSEVGRHPIFLCLESGN